MEMTTSYLGSVPQRVRERYELRETRNAAAILKATNPAEFDEFVSVLDDFWLTTDDLVKPGGNESAAAVKLNSAFRGVGWRSGRVDTQVKSILLVQPYAPAGEKRAHVRESEVLNEGYKVDNVKGRIALDVEWNAKDGNLDRDIGAYRALYDAGLIDGGVILTRTHQDLKALAGRLARKAGLSEETASKRLGTSTTTNLEKLEPRMTRGDGGGCPLLAIAITRHCWLDM